MVKRSALDLFRGMILLIFLLNRVVFCQSDGQSSDIIDPAGTLRPEQHAEIRLMMNALYHSAGVPVRVMMIEDWRNHRPDLPTIHEYIKVVRAETQMPENSLLLMCFIKDSALVVHFGDCYDFRYRLYFEKLMKQELLPIFYQKGPAEAMLISVKRIVMGLADRYDGIPVADRDLEVLPLPPSNLEFTPSCTRSLGHSLTSIPSQAGEGKKRIIDSLIIFFGFFAGIIGLRFILPYIPCAMPEYFAEDD